MNRPRTAAWLACVLTASLLLGACKPAAEPARDAQSAPSPSAAPSQPPAGDANNANAASAGADSDETTGNRETPALRVQTLDGEPFDLATHRGKWVVVNFWATWCAPCLKEMPELSALDAMREHVEVVGLAYEEVEPDALRAFLRKHPVVYPVAIVDVTAPPADFETPRGLPMTYLIGPDGRVAKQFLGPVTAREIEAAIAASGGPAAT